ncbi:MAG: hypothetical protein AAF960_13895 [Bacteroidota bacterium]
MKVLFNGFYANMASVYAIQLELLRQEIDKGNEVYTLDCHSTIPSCVANNYHQVLKCARCQERNDTFNKIAGKGKIKKLAMRSFAEMSNLDLPKFETFEQLIDYHYDGIQIGQGVASSVISRLGNFRIDGDKYQKLIETKLRSAIYIYLNYKYYLEKHQFDALYVYNGRALQDRPIIQLAEKRNVNYYTFVNGANLTKYRLYPNSYIHDYATIQQEIVDEWEREPDLKKKIAVAETFFDQNKMGVNKDIPQYVKNPVSNLLPENFDQNKVNITIYNSSEHERWVFRSWGNTLYNYQNDAIKSIANAFTDHPNVHFYLRAHPNLSNVSNEQVDEILNLDLPNLTVIPPKSAINSYTLLGQSDKIISFGSTIGIEATYWGIPSILYGKGTYDIVDYAYLPNSLDELKSLILDTDLPPKPKINAIKAGYHMKNNGVDLQLASVATIKNTRFEGKELSMYSAKQSTYLFSYLPKIATWLRLKAEYKNIDFLY